MINMPLFVNTITSNIDGDNIQVYSGMALPGIQFKRNGIRYCATDLRPLNEVAREMAINIMKAAAADPEISEVGFDVIGVGKDKLRLYLEILTSMMVKCHKRGFHYNGHFLVIGARYEHDDHGELRDCYLELAKDHARYIYDYAHSNERHDLNYWELVVTVCDRSAQAIMEAREHA